MYGSSREVGLDLEGSTDAEYEIPFTASEDLILERASDGIVGLLPKKSR
jgi:hypothetical protein